MSSVTSTPVATAVVSGGPETLDLADLLDVSAATGTGTTAVLSTSPVIATPDINAGTVDSLTSLSVRDTSAAYDVTVAAVSSTALTAGRTLTLDMVNSARTVKLGGNLTLAGNLITAGAYQTTLTATNTTSLTLPTSGTLATLDGSEALTNKTLTTPTIASFTNAAHNHTDAAGGAQLTDAALSSAVTVAKGGTALTALGTLNQLLGVNAAADALEYKTLAAGANITITPAAGSLTIAAAGGTGAPTDAKYVVLAANGDLSAEVVLKSTFQARAQVDSTTALSLQRYGGDLVIVNGEAVDPGAGGIACATTDNLLAADGTDAGAAMAANTLYYLYVSNASASFAASDLRASATAPSLFNGVYYLAASGNGANWRFCGWVYSNASTQFVNNTTNRNLINYYHRRALPILLRPAYVDNNGYETFGLNSVTLILLNGGTGAVGSYIANGEDAVHFDMYGQPQAVAGQGLVVAIGDNGAANGASHAYTNLAGTHTLPLSFDSTPAAGYRTVQMLGRSNGATTFNVDGGRLGGDVDIWGTYLTGMVRG